MQLSIRVPVPNPLIHTDELMQTLFLSWCDIYAQPSAMWLVFPVSIATAETQNLPPHCAHVSSLFGLHKISASVSECQGCNSVHVKQLNFTPLLHAHFHV